MNFFDLHADTPFVLDLNNPNSSVVDLVNYPFEKYNQVMAIFIRDDEQNPFKLYNRRVDIIKKYLKKQKFPILNGDFTSSGALLSVENAGFLADDINQIYKLHRDGVCMLSLTWNGDNGLASGADGVGGITSKGKDVIKIMNELGMALDISHLSHKAALEATELADNVLATHSGIYSLYPHKRNLKDEVILSLKEKRGIIGLCFYPLFLGNDNVFKALIRCAEYLISLGMEKNVSFGSDFDGADMSPMLSQTAHIRGLFDEFCRRGLKKSLVNGIFYENAIAFFGKICENK